MKKLTASLVTAALRQFGAGSTGAVSDMANRIGLAPQYVRQLAGGERRPPADFRHRAGLELWRNDSGSPDAWAALAADPSPDDAYQAEAVNVHADGFAALLLNYSVKRMLPDYSFDIRWRSSEISWSHSSVNLEIPAYVAGIYMKLFNFEFDECIMDTDEGATNFNLNFGSNTNWVFALPNMFPSIDILSIVIPIAGTVMRTRDYMGIHALWDLSSELLAQEAYTFKLKWKEEALIAISDVDNIDTNTAKFIERQIQLFESDDILFTYNAKLIVCINWIFYGPVIFGDRKPAISSLE